MGILIILISFGLWLSGFSGYSAGEFVNICLEFSLPQITLKIHFDYLFSSSWEAV